MAFMPPNMTFQPITLKRIAGQARSHEWKRACPAK